MDIFFIITLVVMLTANMTNETNGLAELAIILEVLLFTLFVLSIVSIISFWRILEKAGEQGWKSLIPIYNIYLLTVISGNPPYSFLFFFVPIERETLCFFQKIQTGYLLCNH